MHSYCFQQDVKILAGYFLLRFLLVKKFKSWGKPMFWQL